MDVERIYANWLKNQPAKPAPKPVALPHASYHDVNGRISPIAEFNKLHTVHDVLLANGYELVGDRYLRPGSESNIPGVQICSDCKDGVERAYSHGGDVLNDGKPHDAFDLYRLLECGGDQAKALNWNPDLSKHNQRLYRQEQAKDAPESPLKAAGPFPLISAPLLTAKPAATDWLIDNIIERASLNLLFGGPGEGKSLFILDWGFCLAAELEWHGHRTKKTDVVIIAGEGHAGIARRLKALEIKYGRSVPENLFISERPAQLLDANNAQWVADSIRALCPNPGLVIIDTLHRNMDGDENSSQDIGRFIANLDNFLKPLGAAILIVHHSGHGQKDRSRGSSSIRAAMDAEFSATKDSGTVVLTCHKAKDFEAFKPLQFQLKCIHLVGWLDDDGIPLTSVYLEYQGSGFPDNKRKKLTARDTAILASLRGAIEEHGIEPPKEILKEYPDLQALDRLLKVVHLDYWRDRANRAMTVDTENEKSEGNSKRQAFSRCKNKLVEEGYIIIDGDYAWPT